MEERSPWKGDLVLEKRTRVFRNLSSSVEISNRQDDDSPIRPPAVGSERIDDFSFTQVLTGFRLFNYHRKGNGIVKS